MSRNILIAGKDTSEINEFAESMLLSDFDVAVAGSLAEKEKLSSPDISFCAWNKSSPISARSLVLQAETKLNFIKNTVLYFDAKSISEKYKNISLDESSKILDNAVLAFQNLAIEIFERIENHKEKARIIFLLKPFYGYKEAASSSFAKIPSQNPMNPLVSAAESAFAAFAENLAAYTAPTEFTEVLLISGNTTNEIMQNEKLLAKWLSEYIDFMDTKKKKPDAKSASTWIKAGTKTSGFALFR